MAKMKETFEAQHLMTLCNMFKQKYPELGLIFHIPNGGRMGVSAGRRLTAEGVKPGVPDYFLPVSRRGQHGLFIELKVPGGRVSPEQNAWVGSLQDQGYAAFVCWGAKEAWEVITKYLGIQKVS
jgi:hypothetical protein